ncbi:MAG TPA: ABC transporter substrate-binding protein, partial [Anaerolineales bacterium]|nr:ABC transporter substrate-binding protein [Anaerolineales bacterium]
MKIDKRRWILVCSLAVSIAIVFAIVLLKRRGARTDTYRIGAIVFLTGPQAPLGEEVRNALTIATEEINANGGVNTKRVELVYEDSKDSPREAITAFYRLEAERIPVVISTGDVVSLNLAPIAGERKI